MHVFSHHSKPGKFTCYTAPIRVTLCIGVSVLMIVLLDAWCQLCWHYTYSILL